MPADELRLIRHQAGHVVPTMFRDDGVIEIQRYVVVMRVGRNDTTPKLWVQKVQSRLRDLVERHLLDIVTIGNRENANADAGAVGILEFPLHCAPLGRSIVGQAIALLPSLEILDGLEDG